MRDGSPSPNWCRSVAIFLLALAAVGGLTAQERHVTVEILDVSGAPPTTVAASEVVVVEDGTERTVIRVEPVSAAAIGWEVVVWADPDRAEPASLTATSRSVEAAVEALAALGPTTLLVARDEVQLWLEEEVEAEEIAAALDELSMTSFRPTVGGADAVWRNDLLLSSLADFGNDRPKALILLTPVEGSLGRALAAMGWTVLEHTGDASASAAATLAEATGGSPFDESTDLAALVGSLASRFRVVYDGADGADSADSADGAASAGGPVPALDVRTRTVGGRVRGPSYGTSTLPPAVSASRARRFLRLGDEGDVRLQTAVSLLNDAGASGIEMRVEVLARLDELIPPGVRRGSDDLRMSFLLLGSLDGDAELLHYDGAGRDLRDASRWLLEASLAVPGELREIVVVVERSRGGGWGAAVVDQDEDSLGFLGTNTVVETADLRPPPPPPGASPSPDAAVDEDKLIRLLPLTTQQARGTQLFKTLVLNEALDRAEFFLDGEQVAEDRRPPFSARIDLGSVLRPHTLEVVAYDRRGREVGRDSLVVNTSEDVFSVAITGVRQIPPVMEELEVRMSVGVPQGARLERVDVYWNEALQQSLAEAPFTVRLLARPSGTGADYVRAVAVLDDGRTLEDVELFGAQGTVEEVDVNLVEIFSVVTDRAGDPITDLELEDFEVTVRGRPVEVERFGLAEEVPLALGLVIDTSSSMGNIIEETKQAALRFLTDLVTERDQAFVVDFDSQPRLAVGMTQDLTQLFRALGTLSPDGNTALFDSIVFSTLHFEPGQERRALVLLTDGDDYRSRFSINRAISQAKASAVPVYIISLAGLDWLRGSMKNTNLEDIAKLTGGRVFYVESRDQLSPSYAKIGHELRSQYVLTFSSDRELTEKELEKIEIRIRRPKLDVRAVVAGRSVQAR